MSEQQGYLEVVVADKQDRGTGVIVLTLVRADGGQLPPFEAGAHIEMRLSDEFIRHYSLCGDPRDRHSYTLAVLVTRHSRGGGFYLRDRLAVGDRLTIGAPRNQFALVDDTSPALLLAGGIGITPLLPMAMTLGARGVEVQLHYFGRGDTLSAFGQLPAFAAVNQWLQVPGASSGNAATDGAYPAAAALTALLDHWRSRHGRFHLYYCGSLPFMQCIHEYCASRRLPAEDCHYESFTPAEVNGERPFEIEIFSTGQRVLVPADATIVEALSQAGVDVETACGLGICGTCLAEVKQGIPDHRDDYLSEQEKRENRKILLCCSRAHSAHLVIDI